MINIREYNDYVQGIIYFNKSYLENKSFKEEELKEEIKKLNLKDIERKNYLTIKQFIHHLQQLLKVTTYNLYTYDIEGNEVPNIIYKIT